MFGINKVMEDLEYWHRFLTRVFELHLVFSQGQLDFLVIEESAEPIYYPAIPDDRKAGWKINWILSQEIFKQGSVKKHRVSKWFLKYFLTLHFMTEMIHCLESYFRWSFIMCLRIAITKRAVSLIHLLEMKQSQEVRPNMSFSIANALLRISLDLSDSNFFTGLMDCQVPRLPTVSQ